MHMFLRDIRSAGDTSSYNLVTWTQLHEAWWSHQGAPCDVWPLTAAKIFAVGALLKSASYRSGYNYLNAAKDEHIMLGYSWTDSLDWAAKKFTLSVSRGLGPPRQSEPLDFERACLLDLALSPLVPGGPVGTHNLIILFTFFVLRELEGAMARRRDVRINAAARTVTWRLPVSKTDPGALGCERSWGCLCSETAPAAACPFCAAVLQMALLAQLFPNAEEDSDLPFFPQADGSFVEADAVVALIEFLAMLLGEPLASDGCGISYGAQG